MQKNRLYFISLVAVLAAVIIRSAYGMVDTGKTEEKYEISVVVNNSSSDRYISLREGLEQAAQDCGAELNFVYGGNFTTIEEERALIEKELENGAQGIIVQMVSSTSAENWLEELNSRTSFVLIESDVQPENVYSAVLPDNYAMGQELGKQILRDYAEELNRCKIGIVTGKQKELAMQQRMKGLRDALGDYAEQIVWTLDTEDGRIAYLLKKKMWDQKADILVALENDRTEQVVDYLSGQDISPEECSLYGIGCSEKNVYYVDQGRIRLLVVVNEYNMGYQSLKKLVKQIAYRTDLSEQQQVDYLLITRENLYDEEKQKQLFPLVQ